MSNFETFTGTPVFLQNNAPPTPNENINRIAFDVGTLTFFWDRLNDEIYWLNDIDENNTQSWVLFPGTIDNIGYISILPIFQSLYWFVSPSDNPTSNEKLPEKFFSLPYGLLWWNRQNKNLFKLTAYDPETGEQTWTKIV